MVEETRLIIVTTEDKWFNAPTGTSPPNPIKHIIQNPNIAKVEKNKKRLEVKLDELKELLKKVKSFLEIPKKIRSRIRTIRRVLVLIEKNLKKFGKNPYVIPVATVVRQFIREIRRKLRKAEQSVKKFENKTKKIIPSINKVLKSLDKTSKTLKKLNQVLSKLDKKNEEIIKKKIPLLKILDENIKRFLDGVCGISDMLKKMYNSPGVKSLMELDKTIEEYVKEIDWVQSKVDYVENLLKKIELPEKLKEWLDEIQKKMDEVSDYILEETGLKNKIRELVNKLNIDKYTKAIDELGNNIQQLKIQIDEKLDKILKEIEKKGNKAIEEIVACF